LRIMFTGRVHRQIANGVWLTAEEILDGRAHTIDIDDLRIARFQQQSARAETNIY
jgi:hypothetical protein